MAAIAISISRAVTARAATRKAIQNIAQMAERRAAIALQAGIITEGEQRGWLAALRAEQAAGRFLGGQTHLFVWGTRPP